MLKSFAPAVNLPARLLQKNPVTLKIESFRKA
jgi:hypothetical protein